MRASDKFKKPFRAEVMVARLESPDGKVIDLDLHQGPKTKPKAKKTK